MCPASFASAAPIAAGATSMGGILAMYIGRSRNFFNATGLSLFHKR
jgi:hypothetical protein